MNSKIIGALLVVLLPATLFAGTRSRCVSDLSEGGWNVVLSNKYNEVDAAGLAACIIFTGGAGTLACLGNAAEVIAGDIGWKIVEEAIKNRGHITKMGDAKAQAGVCSKTYPIALGLKGTDHYVYFRYMKNGSDVDLARTNTLGWYHDGCNNPGESQTSSCVASMHRYCVDQKGYGAGISMEVGAGVFGTACFSPAWYGDVSVNELATHHDGCNSVHKSRTSDCTAAMHRYCSASGRGGLGMSQEVGANVFGVACFNPGWYGDVPLSKLRGYHGQCDNLGKSQDPACVSAIHRFCANEHGLGAGIAQEVGANVFGVGCFNPGWYGDVAIK